MGYQTAREMVIAITSGGFVVALQAIIESIFGSSSNPQQKILIQTYAGMAIVLFGFVCAMWLVVIKNPRKHEQTWEENRNSIVKSILSYMDDDVITMKPIFQKLESREFNFNNQYEEVTLEDIDEINPDVFKDRFTKLTLIQNVLGFITYEQYSTLSNYMNNSSLFIESLYKQNYRKDLLQSRADEAKKIVGFFTNEEKNHVGLTEWKKRLSQTD